MYKQQLRVHAWKFRNGRLPENQANMLSNISSVHRYATRSAQTGLFISTQDHRSVGYRIPSEWDSLASNLQGMSSITGFKKKSKDGFIAQYITVHGDGKRYLKSAKRF